MCAQARTSQRRVGLRLGRAARLGLDDHRVGQERRALRSTRRTSRRTRRRSGAASARGPGRTRRRPRTRWSRRCPARPGSPSGSENSSASPARTRPTSDFTGFCRWRGAHERRAGGGQRGQLLGADLGRSAAEAAVGGREVGGDLQVGRRCRQRSPPQCPPRAVFSSAGPVSGPMVTAAVRSDTPSLANARSRWVFTVASPMCSSRPISALVRPRATSRSTSISRAVSDCRRGARIRLTSRAATGGASTVSPRAAARIASASSACGAVLEQVAGRAGLDRAQDVGVGVVGGEHQHRGCRAPRGDRGGGRDAVAAGHPQVHQHDVGRQSRGQRDRLGARRRPRRRRRGRARPRACRAGPARTTGWSSTTSTRIIGPPAGRGHDGHRAPSAPGAAPGVLDLDRPPTALGPGRASRAARSRAGDPVGGEPGAVVGDRRARTASRRRSPGATATAPARGVPADVGQRLLGGAQQHHLGVGGQRRGCPGRASVAGTPGLARRPRREPAAAPRPAMRDCSCAGRSAATSGAPRQVLPGRAARPARACRRARRVVASSSASAACSSVTMLVKPCARVSWISPASRSRSAGDPGLVRQRRHLGLAGLQLG